MRLITQVLTIEEAIKRLQKYDYLFKTQKYIIFFITGE